MSLSRQRLRQIIKEEMSHAMDEMTDDEYNEYLQQQHGRFTSPENMRGTPEYQRRNSPPAPRMPAPRRGGDYDYSEYDSLYYGAGLPRVDEADDDMDMDMPDSDDDEMGFEVEDEAMGGMMPGMEPVGEEIDWSQFEAVGADELYDAFNNAIKQLREENPDDEPTAEAVVALMQDMLAAPEEEDAEGESEEMEPEMEGGDEPLNEWIKRTNLLAGTRRR
jgi:hypothetical protein